MPKLVQTWQCLLISPSDLGPEREALHVGVREWNAQIGADRGEAVDLVDWRSHSTPKVGSQPQDVLNEQIVARAELAIALFWTRLGTPTSKHPSGSVEEIEQLVARGAPVLLYFKTGAAAPDDIDPVQLAGLRRVRAQFFDKALVGDFEGASDLVSAVKGHLTKTLSVMGAGTGASPQALSTQTHQARIARDLTSFRTEGRYRVRFVKDPVMNVMHEALPFHAEDGAHGNLKDWTEESVAFEMAGTANHYRHLKPFESLRFALPGPPNENRFVPSGRAFAIPTTLIDRVWPDPEHKNRINIRAKLRPVWTAMGWMPVDDPS
jgi:hypothetical protein